MLSASMTLQLLKQHAGSEQSPPPHVSATLLLAFMLMNRWRDLQSCQWCIEKKILAFGSNILGIDTPLSILARTGRPSLMC